MPRDVFASLVMTASYFFGSLGPGGGVGAAVVAVVAMGPVEGVTAGAARFAVFVDGASATACSGLCSVNVHEPKASSAISEAMRGRRNAVKIIDVMLSILLLNAETYCAVSCDRAFGGTSANIDPTID